MPNGGVTFLTDKELNTKRWQGLLASGKVDQADTCGHNAIRKYFRIADGMGRDKECTNFSSPKRFPLEIAEALKQGRLTSFGVVPKGLLRAPLDKDYQAKRDQLYEDYMAKRDQLYEDYMAKRDPLDKDYMAKRDQLYEDYQAKRDQLYEDYMAKRAPLYKDYMAKRDQLYKDCWALFSDINNRMPNWKGVE
jgi:hypothetical protein